MAQQNQTPDESQALTVTGRKGLERAVDAMQSDIMAVAAPDVVKAGSAWLQRAIISVSSNDNLRPILQSKTGILSVIKGFQKAATMGLQIGGQFPHCHIVGYSDKAELIVSAQGYKHAAIHANGATLTDIEIGRVYEGDKVKIDKGAATVSHEIDPMAERGKLVGVYGIITKLNGKRIVEYMPKTDALRIRDAHSAGYKSGKPSPWKTDEDAMVEKTAVKAFLRPYAAESEGLAMLYSADDDATDWTPPPRDVSDRMTARLEAKTERVASVKEQMTDRNNRQDSEVIEAAAEAINQDAKTVAQDVAAVELF
jgi:phage RecT family recombinase